MFDRRGGFIPPVFIATQSSYGRDKPAPTSKGLNTHLTRVDISKSFCNYPKTLNVQLATGEQALVRLRRIEHRTSNNDVAPLRQFIN